MSHLKINLVFKTRNQHLRLCLKWFFKLTNALDTKSCAMGIFIELAKAFDTVNHKILLQKLSHYGIRGMPLKFA